MGSQSYGFSSNHVWIWELDLKEGWAPKNLCFQTVVLEKTLESPWTGRRSNQSILKEINTDNSLEGLMLMLTDAEASPPDAKSWLIGKHPDAEKDWRQKEKGVAEDEMVGWHYLLSGHEFKETPGNSKGWGSLVCCSPWGHRVRLNWATEKQDDFMLEWPA